MVNSLCITCNNLIMNEIIHDKDGYLFIKRCSCDNKLETLEDIDIIKYFDDGCYELFATIIKVLKVLHSNNLYHGGLKLSNIMTKDLVDEDNNETSEYMICDCFYILLNEGQLNISQRNVNYITPEELSGKECNIKKDMWNIGVLLYKIMSGKFPFQNKKIRNVISNIYNVKYAEISGTVSDLLNPLIHKLLIKESEKRISIEEFETELDRINSDDNIMIESVPFDETEKEAIATGDEEIENLKEKKDVIDDDDDEVKFVQAYKHEDISISEDGQTITNTGGSGYFSHCFLNVKMDDLIHHFIFKIEKGENYFVIGCSANSEYEGNSLYRDELSCSIKLWEKQSILYGLNGSEVERDKLKNVFRKEGETYELIIDIRNCKMSISQGDDEAIFLWSIYKTPVYPFIGIFNKNDSVSLLRYWKEDYEEERKDKRSFFSWWL